jgi:hypothetical protein
MQLSGARRSRSNNNWLQYPLRLDRPGQVREGHWVELLPRLVRILVDLIER